MTNQKYKDITFVFGPPTGDQYERFKKIAIQNEESFSDVFRAFIDDLFNTGGGDKLLNELFSVVVGEKLSLNGIFQTCQYWAGRKEKFKKFYLSSTDQNVEVPGIMVFPSKFTKPDGRNLEVNIDFEHADYVGAMIGQSFKLDWVEIYSVKNEQNQYEVSGAR